MDHFKPNKDLDETQRNAKFSQKLGSTFFSLIFVVLFWYYAARVEVENTCWTVDDGTNTPVYSTTVGAIN